MANVEQDRQRQNQPQKKPGQQDKGRTGQQGKTGSHMEQNRGRQNNPSQNR